MEKPMERVTGRRICTRCLLRELAGSDREKQVQLDQIEAYRAAIRQQDRADDAVYENRLQICRQCERLLAGTCLACGCYVELRAAAKASRCPKKRW